MTHIANRFLLQKLEKQTTFYLNNLQTSGNNNNENHNHSHLQRFQLNFSHTSLDFSINIGMNNFWLYSHTEFTKTNSEVVILHDLQYSIIFKREATENL